MKELMLIVVLFALIITAGIMGGNKVGNNTDGFDNYDLTRNLWWIGLKRMKWIEKGWEY